MDQTAKIRRTEPPEIRRAQILDAAKACFVQSGFALTKVADIAIAAGVSVGSVYRFFPSKEALVEAIIAADTRDQFDRFARALESGPSTAAAVAQFITDLRPMLLDRDRTALMTEIAAEMFRNSRVRSALEIQSKASEDIGKRMAALPGDAAQRERSELRLRMVNALASGVAIEIALNPGLNPERFLDLLGEFAGEILAKA